VSLSGVASNCAVSGGGSQSTSVSAGENATVAFAVTCQSTSPPPDQPPVVNLGGSQTVLEAVFYDLGATFSDPDGDGPWSYQIDWGDGTSSTGSVSAPGALGAGHTYLLPGSYDISVTVTDQHGMTGTATKNLTVAL
jgi:hypothetical protein